LVLRVEPIGTSHILNKCSNTKPHPGPSSGILPKVRQGESQ
jgi:hypothetical protein